MENYLGLDIFINIFVKYAELNTVKYQPEQVMFEFAVKTDITEHHAFIQKCRKTLGLFHKLAESQTQLLNITVSVNNDLSFLRLYRDTISLCEQEIEVLVTLLSDEFKDLLIRDYSGINETRIKRELKKSLLQGIGEGEKITSNIVAYRRAGRVFVFNK